MAPVPLHHHGRCRQQDVSHEEGRPGMRVAGALAPGAFANLKDAPELWLILLSCVVKPGLRNCYLCVSLLPVHAYIHVLTSGISLLNVVFSVTPCMKFMYIRLSIQTHSCTVRSYLDGGA